MFYFDTDEHILDAMNECFAADGGCGSVDSYQKHRLKEKLKEIIKEQRGEFHLTSDRFDDLFAEYLHTFLFNEEGSFTGGYGFEDLCNFVDWLRNEMGVSG